MRVLLIQMPSWGIKSPPYALACLSAYLKDKGIEVIQRDFNIEAYHHFKSTQHEKLWTLNESFWGEIEKVQNFFESNGTYFAGLVNEVLSLKPDLVGFSILWSTERMSRIFAFLLKSLRPDIKIVFGGPQCARQMAGYHLAALPEVDYVVHGEGEVSLYELAETLASGKDVSGIKGLFHKQNGKVIYNGDRPLIKDLDELPLADFSGFNFSLYPDPMIPASTSRGCPNHCIYCDEKMFWHNFRSRSAKNIFAEVKEQYERYGINKFEFVDSLVNGNIKVLEEFCDIMIKEKLPVQWMAQAAVRKEMTRELLSKIKQSGCFHFCFGMEHSSSELMSRMGKNMCKGADFDNLVKHAYEVGLGIGLNWMFGFPGETEEEFQQDLDFFSRNHQYLKGCAINNSPGFCGFTPGCYAYNHPEEFNVVLGPDGCSWKSDNGTNTYITRLQKFQKFSKHLEALGLGLGFPPFKNEEELINKYNAMVQKYLSDKLKAAEELIEKEDLAGAKSLLQETLRFEPDYIDALNDMAVVGILEEDLINASEMIRKILKLDPANAIANGNMAYLQTVAPKLKPMAARPNNSIADASEARCICNNKTIPDSREILHKELLPGTKSQNPKGIICLNPFYEFEIDITGKVVVCCTAWLKARLGNMKKQDIAGVWNGQIARYIRRKMYRGEWEGICSESCPTIVQYKKSGKVIPFEELDKFPYLTPKHVEEILAGKDYLESTPTVFKLSDSKICNLKCKMCSVIQSDELVDDQEMLDRRSKDIEQYLDKAKIILMSGNGDPFARKDTRELLMNYNSNPNLEFSIVTNGLLLPRFWEKIKHQKFESINISVDAATKDVYEKIRIGGKWEDILRTLALVKENKNKFGNVLISMVVMRSNYRHIPAFIDMVESYGFLPLFSRIHGMFEDENFFEMNDHNALQELSSIIRDEKSKKRSVDVLWQDLLEFAD